jgi:predicted transglutaminase-like cysteine proteinase
MTILRTLLQTLSAGLLASGCATLDRFDPVPEGARLIALEAVPAPAGIDGLCERAPHECAETAGAPVEAPDPLALFRSLAAHNEAAPAIAAPQQPGRIGLTEERRLQLARVNHDVNAAIRPAPDEDVYGEPDRWVAPADGLLPARGDCEDYALAKRAMLLAEGWPGDTLSLAAAMGERGLHVVLVAHTDAGDLVLDSAHDSPLALAAARYRWLLMQTGPDLRAWRTVRTRKRTVV